MNYTLEQVVEVALNYLEQVVPNGEEYPTEYLYTLLHKIDKASYPVVNAELARRKQEKERN